jgi:hypothetical protein
MYHQAIGTTIFQVYATTFNTYLKIKTAILVLFGLEHELQVYMFFEFITNFNRSTPSKS